MQGVVIIFDDVDGEKKLFAWLMEWELFWFLNRYQLMLFWFVVKDESAWIMIFFGEHMDRYEWGSADDKVSI